MQSELKSLQASENRLETVHELTELEKNQGLESSKIRAGGKPSTMVTSAGTRTAYPLGSS